MRLSVQHARHKRIATALAICAAAFLPTASVEMRFEARTSGKCTDASGWAWVGSEAECEEGATALRWRDTIANVTYGQDYPRGCYYTDSGVLYFNAYNSRKSCSTSETCMCTTGTCRRSGSTKPPKQRG